MIASLPKMLVELQEVADDRPLESEAALEPILPAHIAARHESFLPVHDHELGMHNAEWSKELAADLQV